MSQSDGERPGFEYLPPPAVTNHALAASGGLVHPSAPHLSADGEQWWDGQRWVPARRPAVAPTVSPDGRFWWNGQQWIPMPATTPVTVAVPTVVDRAGRAYIVSPKSPGLALIVSFFIPGVGSMMNGEVGKGFVILSGYLVSLLLTLVFIGIVGVLIFWIWGMADAYQGAVNWNRRHGIYS